MTTSIIGPKMTCYKINRIVFEVLPHQFVVMNVTNVVFSSNSDSRLGKVGEHFYTDLGMFPLSERRGHYHLLLVLPFRSVGELL